MPYAGSRLWQSYLRVLSLHPLRTKMITSGAMFTLGDCVAQFGIEGRRLGLERIWSGPLGEEEDDRLDIWKPTRTARQAFYGSVVFAPLAHTWLNLLQKVQFQSKVKTLLARLLIDTGVWGPFIVATFWTANGFLEGKDTAQVKKKVEMAFIPSLTKATCVFLPTQIVNLAFTPPQHRLMVLQTVGLGWNIFLSYQNNINNLRLAQAEALLQEVKSHTLPLSVEDKKELKDVERKVEDAKRRQGELKKEGGALGVGTRMSWS
ncbi:hypothetical protein P7C73_g5242, partial [Tremellales sp. Uapishka_1]